MLQNNNVPDDIWIYGNMFTSPTEYSNPLLKGRFRLKMRGNESLIHGVEWDYLEEGGVKIFVVPGWACSPDVKILIEFY